MILDTELKAFIDYDEYICRLLQRLGLNIQFEIRENNWIAITDEYNKW